jgi:RNA polymerase sigma factor (sigma-70 family)
LATVSSDRAFQDLRPLLLAVLRRLSTQGYTHAFSDGLDCLHDFYLELWPGLQERFEPQKGTLQAYAATAFARFARRRLIRQAQWQRTLSSLDPDSLRGSGDVGTGEHSLSDQERMRTALAALSAEDRDLLAGRIIGNESERAVATRLGWSRYQVRLRVAEVLAELAARFGESSQFSPGEVEIVRALFVDKLSVVAAAARVGVSETRARQIQKRVLDSLVHAVGGI